MKKYKLVCKKGEGTFSEVVKAENIENGKEYAIKCMKGNFDSFQQVNNLREIQALKRLSPHPNIIHLEEVLFDQPSGRLAMVFELMDANLYDLISGRRDHLDQNLVISLGYQMFVALEHMHKNGIFHRDIKPENILVDKTGTKLKLADLGSCRSLNANPPMTEYIATRWYRSPECLLTDGHYGVEMDIWGAGCVLFEIIALFPLFPGSDEVDQVNRIHKVVGSPEAELLASLEEKGNSKINYKFSTMKGIGIKHFIPHASLDCIDLLVKTMIYDHKKRIDSEDAVQHKYFSELYEKEKTVLDTSVEKDKPMPVLKKKLTLRKHARVRDDTKLVDNRNKHTNVRKVALAQKEAKKGAEQDSKNRKTIKMRNANHSDNLKSIKSTLRKSNNENGTSKLKASKEKESNVVKNVGRRRRPAAQVEKPIISQDKPARLQKIDKKKEKKPKQNNANVTKQPSKRKKKYSNIQSSGYGKATSNATQSKSNQSSFQSKTLKSRIRKTKEEKHSGGTNATANTSLPSIRHSNLSHRLQKKKLSLQRNGKNEKPALLPPIKA